MYLDTHFRSVFIYDRTGRSWRFKLFTTNPGDGKNGSRGIYQFAELGKGKKSAPKKKREKNQPLKKEGKKSARGTTKRKG